MTGEQQAAIQDWIALHRKQCEICGGKERQSGRSLLRGSHCLPALRQHTLRIGKCAKILLAEAKPHEGELSHGKPKRIDLVATHSPEKAIFY
jgi:hypothetical protein